MTTKEEEEEEEEEEKKKEKKEEEGGGRREEENNNNNNDNNNRQLKDAAYTSMYDKIPEKETSMPLTVYGRSMSFWPLVTKSMRDQAKFRPS